MKTNNGSAKILATAVLGASTLGAPKANAATIHQFPPLDLGALSVAGLDITNDDAGATYNSLTVDTSDLVEQLAALNGLSIGDTAAQMSVSIDGVEDVDLGWNANYNAAGDVEIGNVGGIPGVTYHIFDEGKTMRVNLVVPDSLLGDKYLAFGDANAGLVEAMSGLDSTYGSGNSYKVVPEPASLALMGLGGLAMYGRRRKE